MKCDHLDGARCTLGLYGGAPSPGVCGQCKSYRGPARGAGDVVAAIAAATGVKAVVELVNGGPCINCGARQESLNRAMPFGEP